MTTLRVAAAVLGRRRAGAPDHELDVSLPADDTTLRELIGAIVRAEVAAFQARADGERLLRVLTEANIQEGLETGAIRSGGRTIAAEVDPEDAVRTAVLAQQDGLFQTIIDDEPIDELDRPVTVRTGTRVMFLRLVPLAGG